MKKSDSHVQLSWKLGFTLHVPVPQNRGTKIATRILIGACLLSFALGLTPLIGLLLAGP